MNSLVLCVLDLIVQTIGPKPTLNQSDTSHYILAYSLEKPSILPHNRQSRSNSMHKVILTQVIRHRVRCEGHMRAKHSHPCISTHPCGSIVTV